MLKIPKCWIFQIVKILLSFTTTGTFHWIRVKFLEVFSEFTIMMSSESYVRLSSFIAGSSFSRLSPLTPSLTERMSWTHTTVKHLLMKLPICSTSGVTTKKISLFAKNGPQFSCNSIDVNFSAKKFSSSAHTVTPFRNRLNTETIRATQCLKSWM